MAINKKNTNTVKDTTSTKQVIKVNAYETPDSVLDLMSRICSAKPTAETDVYWSIINDAYNKEIRGKKLADFLRENRKDLWNQDFGHELSDLCRQMAWAISTRDNTEHTQIVVAGGFSSGKSSFLNKLTHCTNLLPTGVEPVSVVKTYLYCSSRNNSITVKGVNLKNVLVTLDVGVLQAIQHASKSNIYLTSVLEKLFVEIPSKELNGLVFIDTPGYNNSDTANESNNKTDRETALEALGEGNVLFWLIDCEKGTTVADDIQMIKQFDGKKVIIFNKADKKGVSESKKIVEEAANVLYKEFRKENIIDIIAFSTLDNRIYYSKNNYTIDKLVKLSRQCGNGKTAIENIKGDIEGLFDTEIQVSVNTIKGTKDEAGYEAELKECITRKDEYYKFWQNDKNDNDDFLELIRNIMVNNYSEVANAAKKNYDYADYAFEKWKEFHDSVIYFEENDHWGSSSILDRAISKSANAYNSKNKQFYGFNWNFYDEELRKDRFNVIKSELEKLNSHYQELYDDACKETQRLKDCIDKEKELQKRMSDYKDLFMAALTMGIKEYQRRNTATEVASGEHNNLNVFDSIKIDDYKTFLRCFENGVDLNSFNADGYSPLTLSVSMGNAAMVRFLLDKGASSSQNDKRGYNAFHTAVENQYRNICMMLLDDDPDLLGITTSKGETVEQLASKQTFDKWLQQEIDNAF